MGQKTELNWIYFGIFFLILLSLTAFPYYLWGTPLLGIPLFFFIYAIGQAVLEVALFIFIASLLNRWAPRWLFYLYIGLSFAVLLLHFVDFTIIRLMDASLSHLTKYFFGSGFSHLFAAFQALNVNQTFILLAALIIAAIPVTGIAIYRVTQPLAKKVSWKVPLFGVALSIFCLTGFLIAIDYTIRPSLTTLSYHKFEKTLPIGKTFLSPNQTLCSLSRPIAGLRDENEVYKELRNNRFEATSTPNIYLFVIETLRRDYITTSIAPNLSLFGKENISFEKSYANSNSTNTSWFAIFHANFPYHWTAARDEWSLGSVPLQILKQLGYKIRVYSSADLRYFGMDQVLFGKQKLYDQMEEFTEVRALESFERDALCFQSFQRDLQKPDGKEKNLFVFFLDSTHSEYSFPESQAPRFSPITDKIDYLTVGPDALEPLINRYKNAIYYVDSLMGQFFTHLKEQNLYDDAVIAITGDHGEEFFEEGALFHGTHLNEYQTAVPLLYKLGTSREKPLSGVSTHLDIFPTILHHLTGRADFASLFDGQSLFDPNRWSYRLAVMQNGPNRPVEFTLQSNDVKAHFRFCDASNLELISSVGEISESMLAPISK